MPGIPSLCHRVLMGAAVASLMGAASAADSASASRLQQPPLFNVVEEIKIVSDESSRDMALTQVTDLTVLSDGSIVTAHATESLLRVFDPAGRFVRSFGRSGAGPGEFGRIRRIGSVGDTIWTDDLLRPRIQLFTRDGRLVRTFNTGEILGQGRDGRGRGAGSRLYRDSVVGLLTDGRTIMQRSFRSSPGRASLTPADSEMFFLGDSAGVFASRLLGSNVRERPPIVLQTAGSGATLRQPLDARPHALVAPGGERHLIVFDAEDFGGQPGQIRLTETVAGRPVSTVVSLQPRPLPRNYADSSSRLIAARMYQTLQGRLGLAINVDALAREIRAGLHVPSVFPITGAVLGRDGVLWIAYPDGSLEWVALQNGRPQRRVRLPAGISISQASLDRIWAIESDANGLPVIRRYRVVPP